MFITILIILIACIAVGLFQILFNELETKPYKRKYYESLFKLSENPNDIELKDKVLEAGIEYYRRIRVYKINTFKGAPASVSAMNSLVTMDEKILFEDMTKLTKINKTVN
jgi:hypothetical protein